MYRGMHGRVGLFFLFEWLGWMGMVIFVVSVRVGDGEMGLVGEGGSASGSGDTGARPTALPSFLPSFLALTLRREGRSQPASQPDAWLVGGASPTRLAAHVLLLGQT